LAIAIIEIVEHPIDRLLLSNETLTDRV
jgi:hypothetical protein